MIIIKYRDFGKTGKKVSAVGFGCMRLPEFEKDGKWFVDEEKTIPMLLKAYESGINYFDTAHMYCHDNSQYTLGKAVKQMDREKVMVATKQPLHLVEKTEDFRKVLEEQLRRLDMRYIDFYHFHGINKGAMDSKILPLGLMNEARKAIDEGLIRNMSFSFHGNPDDMPYIIEKGEIFSSVLLQYNLLDRSNENAIKYLGENGIGVVVMGPVAGGRLAAPSHLSEKLLGEKSVATPELAVRFVLGNKNVSCALSGMGNMDMLDQNLKTGDLDDPMNEETFEKVKVMMEEIKKFSELYCTGCNYCMPCVQEINIPHIFNAYTYHNVYGLTGHAKHMINETGKGHRHAGKSVDECIECGACAAKCPQNIDIPAKLKEVVKIITG